jgi:hypothetical protein
LLNLLALGKITLAYLTHSDEKGKVFITYLPKHQWLDAGRGRRQPTGGRDSDEQPVNKAVLEKVKHYILDN